LALNGDVFAVTLQGGNGSSGTSGLLQMTWATAQPTNNGIITLNNTSPNATVEHALTFDGTLLHLTGSLKVNTVDLTYISESNSTTHTNYSSSNSTTFTNLSSSNSTTFTNLSSSNSTTFTNYSSSVSESISFYSQSFANTHNVFTQSQIEINLGISEVSGALNRFTASLLGQVDTISIFTASVNFTTQSLNTQTGSQDLVNLRISSTTGSINTTTSSFDQVFVGISSVTGAINTTTSSFDNVFLRISSTTGSINTTTSSFDNVFLGISSVTGAINTTTSSFDNVFLGISSVTGAINTTTSSFDSVFLGISSVTGAMNTTTSSFDSVFVGISSVTGAINTTTSSFDLVFSGISSVTGAINTTTASFDSEFIKIGLTTSSIHYTTESLNYTSGALNTQTGSQDVINLNNSVWTGSVRYELNDLEAYTSSLKAAIVVNGTNVTIIGELSASKIYTEYITSSVLFVTGSNIIGDQSTDRHEFTGSVHIKDTLFLAGEPLGNSEINAFTASQINNDIRNLYVTGALNSFTSSQIGKDYTLSVVTASIDAHILTQATQTGSQDLVNLGISTFTGSQNVINTSVDAHILGISIYTSSANTTGVTIDAHILKQATQTGSQDLVNLGISEVSGALNRFTSSQDNLNYNLSILTASIDAHILKQATQTGSQDLVNLRISSTTGSINTTTSSFDLVFRGISSVTGAMNTQSSSQHLVNLNISTFTGSIRSEISLIEAYTASLKAATIVSSSTQIQNYFLFAQTSSANTFYGNQTITGSLFVSATAISDSTLLANSSNLILTSGSNLYIYNDGLASISGSLKVTGSIITTLGITGPINATNGVISSSAQLTSLNTYTGSNDIVIARVLQTTASLNSKTGSYATTGSNTFIGNQTISGSLIVTASVNLSGSVVINRLTYPNPTFGDGQYGVEVPTLGVDNIFTMEVPKTMYAYVKNDSGATLLKGTPVHSIGTVGFNTLVIAASASVATSMPATFILAQDLDAEEEGLGISMGAIQGVDTTGLIAGDSVWVGANGGFTQTKPTGSNLIQNLGIVTKVGVNGGGVILGAGRANDVPNIQQGYIWVGNKDSVATATPTSSFELSGRGVVSGSNQLPQIAGLQEYTASLKGAAIVSSSQQITNYYKFAETASANTFYGTQTISGDIKAISNTNSTLTSVQLGTAVNGTGGGNRGFDGSFTGTTNSFIGIDATDQGYGYFPATIVSGNTYTLFFKSVETNGTLGTIITSNGTNFATDAVQTLTLPIVTNGVYNIVTFTASASATHIGFAGYPTTGTITLTISEVSIVNGIADANIGKLIVQRSLVANGDSIFKGNQTISGTVMANQFNVANVGGKFAGEGGVTNYLGIYKDDSTPILRAVSNSAGASDVIVSTGNLVIGTSGKGIDFSATSNGSGTTNSELLNDYEEGTFTPTVEGTSTAGTATYTDRSASYTKIGKCVFFRIDVIWSGHTGTGSIKITGLPFTIGQNYMTSITTRFDQTTTANNYLGGGFIYATQVEPQLMPVGGGATSGVPITAAGDMRIAGHYFV
jgi:hypothetical protein